MAVNQLEIQPFLEMACQFPVFDVRSPSEFAHAHIPDAYSLPLFRDEERKVVGTAYKQISRKQAIKIGLDYFGPKMREMVTEVDNILESQSADTVLVHCWRGGMRSAAVAWLLDLYGYKVFTLKGGYKAFRSWVFTQFEVKYSFFVLGGYTGSGKTEILQALKNKNETVLDLEFIAGHKGSAFGNLGLPEQTSIEHFENKLAIELLKAEKDMALKSNRIIWVEAESPRIGQVNMPNSLFSQLQDAQSVFIEIPFENRLQFILQNYGKFEKDKLIGGIYRIRKRLGGLDTKNAINFLLEGNVVESFKILLEYYDRLYVKSTTTNRKKIKYIVLNETNASQNAEAIINLSTSNDD